MNWIKHPVTLTGTRVRLEPLTDGHTADLVRAGRDARIWAQLPIDGSDEQALRAELTSARAQRLAGTQYPFALIDIASGAAFGSTRLFDVFPQHRKLEIGWTWMQPEYWGGAWNAECKLLLLAYCFETLGAHRVQLKTRDTNLRSAAAIRKIGAQYEGCLRKDRVMPGGVVRDTLMFSIVDDEWPEVKQRLQEAGALQAAPTAGRES